MRKLWNNLSNVGLKDQSDSLELRANRLSNQINLVLIIILSLLNMVTVYVDVLLQGETYNLYSSRLLLLEVVLLFNIYLSHRGQFMLVKVSLIFLPALTLIIIPCYLGFVQTSSFFYYHIIVIGLSLTPVAILNPIREVRFYAASIGYFFIIMLFLDDVMINLTPSEQKVKELISHFRIYYKIIPLCVFCFIQLALLYLRRQSVEYEKALARSNNDLKEKLHELERMQMHLVQSEKMISLGTMVAGVAHEMNNPLNFIRGGLEVLKIDLGKNGQNTPDIQKSLAAIDEGIERTSQLVSSMKSFSYKQSLVKESVSLNDLFDDSLILLGSKIADGTIIQKNYNTTRKIEVYKEKILQVIVNLLDNAIYETGKMNANDRLISIKTAEHFHGNKSTVRATIYNSGSNIPPEVLSRIFDPFFTTKEPGKGTGLGLSISYSNISFHDGKLSVNNKENGVEFTFEIP